MYSSNAVKGNPAVLRTMTPTYLAHNVGKIVPDTGIIIRPDKISGHILCFFFPALTLLYSCLYAHLQLKWTEASDDLLKSYHQLSILSRKKTVPLSSFGLLNQYHFSVKSRPESSPSDSLVYSTSNHARSISSNRFAYWTYWYFWISGSSITSATPAEMFPSISITPWDEMFGYYCIDFLQHLDVRRVGKIVLVENQPW